MKRKILLLLFAVLSLNVVGQVGQDYFAIISSYQADSSIIRNWKYPYSLVYTSTTNGDYYFHLIDNATGVVRSVAVNENVTDMEIVDDRVYYCGNTRTGNPVACFLDIPDIISGTATVKNLNCTTDATIKPKKMDVIKVVDGFHIFVVGDWYDYGSTTPNSFVADISQSIYSSLWAVNYYKAEGNECFEDIVAADNYVVTTGHVDNTSHIILRLFELPTYATSIPPAAHSHIFYNSSLTDSLYQYVGSAPRPLVTHDGYPILITKTKNGRVVFTHLANFSVRGGYGLSIKDVDLSTGVPTAVKEINSTWGSELLNGWNVMDIRYNKQCDSILILQHKNHPHNGLYKYFPATTDNGSFTILTDYESANSVDMHSIEWQEYDCSNVFSGAFSINPCIGNNTPNPSECYWHYPVSIEENKYSFFRVYMPTNNIAIYFSQQGYHTTAILSNISIICHEK